MVSLKDSLACGAHFYCIDHMEKMLHALIAEHFSDEVTNSEHPKTILMVVQWTLALRDRLVDDDIPRHSHCRAGFPDHLEKPSTPLSFDLRCVTNLCNRYEVLVPRRS